MTLTYWTLKDDGALFRCLQCNERKPAAQMVWLAAFTIKCKSCVGEEWLAKATNMGEK